MAEARLDAASRDFDELATLDPRSARPNYNTTNMSDSQRTRPSTPPNLRPGDDVFRVDPRYDRVLDVSAALHGLGVHGIKRPFASYVASASFCQRSINAGLDSMGTPLITDAMDSFMIVETRAAAS